MNLAAHRTTLIAGVRREGWRAALRDDGEVVWRCDCHMPHSSRDRAIECATEILNRRASGFYPGNVEMSEWMTAPTTDEQRQELVARIQMVPTTTNDEALELLDAWRSMIMRAESYEEIRTLQGATEGIRRMRRANQEVRNQCDITYLTGEWRIGQALLAEQAAEGGEAYHQSPRPGTRFPGERVPSLREKVGSKMYGWRLKTIAPLAIEALHSAIKEYHRREKEATLTGVVKILRGEESTMRRWDSLTSPPVENGLDLRIGDCRVMLSDIEDESVPLILTDPPYEEAAEPLWEWLGAFAKRVLIPGGSLVCYFGGAHINRLYRIFDDAGLVQWYPAVMLHDNAQRLGGKFVIAQHKPILWYVKEFRRDRRLISSVVSDSRPDKTKHSWAQGDGGIRVWIHQLTEPKETIIDPFAGTAEWGRITCIEGRYWIGSDIVAGGTTDVRADEPEESSEGET